LMQLLLPVATTLQLLFPFANRHVLTPRKTTKRRQGHPREKVLYTRRGDCRQLTAPARQSLSGKRRAGPASR
jgi:hypothetical protein